MSNAVNDARRKAVEKRALLCLQIATLQLTSNASQQQIEKLALTLMPRSDDMLEISLEQLGFINR